MIVEFKDQLKKIRLVRSGKMKEGLKLDIPELDEHFRFKFTNFNVILGHANVGKTTVILYLMLLYSLKHKVKWLVFSSENESYTIIKKLVEFMCIKPINRVTEDELNSKSDWIYDHFKFIDNNSLYSYTDLLSLADTVKNNGIFKVLWLIHIIV